MRRPTGSAIEVRIRVGAGDIRLYGKLRWPGRQYARPLLAVCRG